MKVVNIIQRYSPAIGGSEAWCEGMCRYLAKNNVDVEVLTMNVYNEDEFWRDPAIANCTVRLGKLEYDNKILIRRYQRTKISPLSCGFFKYILDGRLKIYFYGPHSIEMYIKMAGRIRQADIVHLHTIPYPHNLIGFVIAKLLRKKVVITPHFHPEHPFYERKINYWLMKNCNAVFCVSDYEKDYFIKKGLDKNKLFVAYNAVDPEEFKTRDFSEFKRFFADKYKISNSTKTILFIGRKTEYKGVDHLIESVSRLLKKRDLRLFLVGPDFPWFKEFYAKLSEEDREKIIDLGVITHQEKVNLLHMSNILALPSKYEAFGIVFLEAWVCGVPVIGVNTGAMAHLIKDSGLTAKYGDVDDLTAKIEQLLSNPELSKKLGSHGKNKVFNNFVWDKAGSQILEVYKRLSPEPVFNEKINLQKSLGKGWHPIEGSGSERWAWSKKEAILKLPKRHKGIILDISCGDLDVLGHFNVNVYNQRSILICKCDFDASRKHIHIPTGASKIRLIASELWQPSVLFGNDDKRKLGIRLHSIQHKNI